MASKKQLSVLWTKHLKDKSKKSDFESTIRNSRTALERLSQILDQYIAEAVRQEANFEDPNWPYRQANLVGQRQAYNNIKNLIDIY